MKRIKLRSFKERMETITALAQASDLCQSNSKDQLLREMIALMGEMGQKITQLETEIQEMQDAMEDMDTDLADMEEAIFGDEDDCDHCHDDDEEEDDEDDPFALEDFFSDGEIAFDCPHCGTQIVLHTSDIDVEKSPVCTACNKPFFQEITIDD